MSSMDMEFLPPRLPPFYPFKKGLCGTDGTFHSNYKYTSWKSPNASSAKAFTVALLEQYANSFSHENIIGEGMLGSIYRGELPNGKVRFFELNKN